MAKNALTQYGLRRGLKEFGDRQGHAGYDAVLKEVTQFHDWKVAMPIRADRLSKEKRVVLLAYLIFIKQKRNGSMKGSG